jgi:hypothetical protein
MGLQADGESGRQHLVEQGISKALDPVFAASSEALRLEHAVQGHGYIYTRGLCLAHRAKRSPVPNMNPLLLSCDKVPTRPGAREVINCPIHPHH